MYSVSRARISIATIKASSPFRSVVTTRRRPDVKDNFFLSRVKQSKTTASVPSKQIFAQVKAIAPNDQYVSCTTFDSNGNITTVSKKYPKKSFLLDNKLFPRDFRKIDTLSIDVAPLIMIRSANAILINLLHIKAIIKKDTVMVFDTSAPEAAARLGLFMYDLELKLKPSPANRNVSYEFRALESILINVMSNLEADLKVHLVNCGLILSQLENQINRDQLQDLLIKSKNLNSYYQKAVLIRNVLEELLDNDEDLAGMYLSEPNKYDGTEIDAYDDLEMLLEAYYNHCDEFVQHSGSVLSDIKQTEEIVNIILDANRNSLMVFELRITVYTLGFAVATLVPAFYGMNLKNYIEDTNWGFGMVIAISIIQGLVVTLLNFRKLHSVQKLTMTSSPLSKSSTSDISPTYAKTLRNRQKLWYRLLYGNRNTTYDKPTPKERDVIWRMINNDRTLK
ncbi:magnesium ion transporter [Scheffersomyces spartinae]|uniref:Magnesium transporter n=1 Tax=Scheffersomyces spartinae TaxID=45513 RepID=A0A9P8AIW8_9ASCO|nr:magnesium ion transporter [Scheffersomyces spartinae]KAG7193561.1 magnesium ion transporter [Scheffersomyces spartinae]